MEKDEIEIERKGDRAFPQETELGNVPSMFLGKGIFVLL
jgi:hypothetical protein